MKALLRAVKRRPVVAAMIVVLVGALIASAVVVGMLTGTRTTERDASPQPTPAASGSPGTEASAAPVPTASLPPDALPAEILSASPPVECPEPTVESAGELERALADAEPGDVISLASGTYGGNFVATASGTAERPIILCGSPRAVLDGSDARRGYGFHLDGAQYWRLSGFTVTRSQKGVMADGTVGSIIEGLTVTEIGDEGIHLRRASTDNSVRGNVVSATGNRRERFGEGIYVGSAESNWCEISGCSPDASDRNLIEGNVITGTTAESIDVKEGTTGGIVRANSFDGADITGADSWVDVKGTGWLIEDNAGSNSPGDGYQTHEIVEGWGTGNVFRRNIAVVNGPGFGYALTPVLDNVVECSNTATGAGSGLANVECAG